MFCVFFPCRFWNSPHLALCSKASTCMNVWYRPIHSALTLFGLSGLFLQILEANLPWKYHVISLVAPAIGRNKSKKLSRFVATALDICGKVWMKSNIHGFTDIHTLRVHYAHAAANLNSGYSKYAIVARVHYFCTIALWTSRAVLMRAWDVA